MEITLQLFGPYRAFGTQVTLILPDGGTVADIRPALKAAITANSGLIDSSRFATDVEVLADAAPLHDKAVLAVIPPVSGG